MLLSSLVLSQESVDGRRYRQHALFFSGEKPLTAKTKSSLIRSYRRVSGRYQFLKVNDLIALVKKNLGIDLNAISEEAGLQILRGVWAGVKKQGIW